MLCHVKSNLPINCEIEIEVFKWDILFFVLFWATTKLHFVNIFHTSNISAASLVFLKKRDFLRLTIVFLRNYHILIKAITFSEFTPKIKLLMLYQSLFSTLLTSAVIWHLNFLYGEEIAQYLFIIVTNFIDSILESSCKIFTNESKVFQLPF